ncbi:helix-turn-helix transcriptional regulator [Pseudonocardia adelaidensis]|uniref:helix-turn-helix transcriptional regulator n=1 Tax=Pseudonocardia adelaidensis TaxID=648754 RepID=UPI0031E6E60D
MRVPEGVPVWRPAAGLTGRRTECGVLDRLVEAVRHPGESRALVVHGDAGVGKTALLEYLAGHAPGCRLARAAGVQSEMELAFAGLHQLCAPMLDRLDSLPVPQRDALRTAFGMLVGPAPDPFVIGLAVLGLLSHVAEERPLLCLVDDAQWLDHASAQVLTFVARRLGAESVGLVFGARAPSGNLAGLPEMAVRGLPEADARVLLDSVLTGPIDLRVRDQIVVETRGNPLALLEIPRGLTVAELAGGFGLPGALPLAGSIEESFRRRIDPLHHESRQLLLVAADPTGDPALLCRAGGLLGIGADATAAAADAGLAEFGIRVRFRHPLARSAVYRSAPTRNRQQAHQALADVTDQRLDPDRRAWHRAQAAPGPDDEVAAELERSAGRARARGGPAAAAAFLKQAATLTFDPEQRAGRALSAAQATIQAGLFDVAHELLDMAESGPLSDLQQATVDVTRAQLAFNTSRGGDAPALLVNAARRLEPIDADLSRATYLDAVSAAIFAAGLAGPGGDVVEVARAAASAPPPRHAPRGADLLLDGTAAGLRAGYAAGVPVLRRGLAAFGADMSADEELRWMWLACITALRLWDDDRWEQLSARYLQLARTTGALSELPLALTARAHIVLFTGDLSAAESLTDELQVVVEATGSGLAPYGEIFLAALRGDGRRAHTLIDATLADVTLRGEGVGITLAESANALLGNGLGHYDEAVAAGQRATAHDEDPASHCWALVELVEAAARSGMTETAAGAYRRLTELTGASGTEWALGAEARSHALLREGDEAERLYREALARFSKTRLRVDLARAHLLYGEWLRRERRRGDAREQLRTAYDMLESMGVAGFAERARHELRAIGGTARRRGSAVRHEELTAQETQIARLARDGLSNPEIGARLFISAHTVQYHLRKVFPKLGITSRSQLDRVLPASTSPGKPG